MNVEEFKELTEDATGRLGRELQALWWAAHGDWDRAHGLCQEAGTREGDWVHAYLHRVEGDAGNARYWYARAGRRWPEGMALEAEWAGIVAELLGR